jgi:hypothetical protein
MQAQTVEFEFQFASDSPVAFVNFTPGTVRSRADRRQFFTVRNDSDKTTVAVVFQQAMGSGSRSEIVTLERVSVYIRPNEKKRISLSVRDTWNRLRSAAEAGEEAGKPVLSVAVVEFAGGSAWSASSGQTRE